MAKIIQERNKCIGCGACVSVCPSMFEMSEDSKATLKNSKENSGNLELETADADCAKEAADVCPVKIIKIQK
ncbi:MAG: ferredoxin [Candidatus Pacebacteria bacterium]|nr:ferredoxin [Candidatus Paceibacterota bacterium]